MDETVLRLRMKNADAGLGRSAFIGALDPDEARRLAYEIAEELGGAVSEHNDPDGSGETLAGGYTVHVPEIEEVASRRDQAEQAASDARLALRRVAVAQFHAGRPKSHIAASAGITRATLDAWIRDDDSALARAVSIQVDRIKIHLYETDSTVYLQRDDGPVWGPTNCAAGPPVGASFAQDAEAWVTGEWEPCLSDGWEPVEDTQGLRLVASWSRATGLELVHEPGANAEEYITYTN